MPENVNQVIIKGRQLQKHDTEANWNKAINFAPLFGEIIVYDPDENYPYPRYKTGIWDGKSTKTDAMLVYNLPFSNQPVFEPADPAIIAVGRDKDGHVKLGGELIVQSGGGGEHSHTASVSVDANTYIKSVTPTSTKLAISPSTTSVLTGVEGAYENLDVTQVIPVSASVTKASKATAGTATDIAKVGAEVRYGTANVGTTVEGLAKRAATPTIIGNAKVGTGTTVASGSVTSVSAPVISVKVNSATKDAYNAEYDSAEECLILSPVTITAAAPTVTLGTKTIKEAVISDTTIWGVTDAQVTVTSATEAPDDQKLTTAKANGQITPYTFTDVDVPIKATPVTVATGSLSIGGDGEAVMVGPGKTTSTTVLNGAAVVAGTTGDVTVVASVASTKNTRTTFSGSTGTHTEDPHIHTLVADTNNT